MKKRCIAAFAAALLLLTVLTPAQAYAADQLLVIDTGHLYAGMDKTYGQGYAPQVSAEEAVIRMPLIVSEIYQGTVQGGAIMVSPNLGDPQKSPFITGDFSQTVSVREYTVQDEQSARAVQQAYYIVLYLPLQAARANGTYPVDLHISYLNGEGLSIQQSFTVDVTVTDGMERVQNTKGSVSSQIVLADYEVSPAVVQAGTAFSVDFTMQNTSESGASSDIMVTYNSETEDIRLRGSTGTLFVSSIEKGGAQICHIEMDALNTAKTGMHRLFLNLAYTDENGVAATASFEVPVMVRQPVRLQYGQPSVPAQAVSGSDLLAALLISNSGMDTLYDVSVSLASDGFISNTDTFLGNMESGVHKTASIVARASGGPGDVSGRFIVSYEDQNGMQYTEEVPFKSYIAASSGVYWKLPVIWRVVAAVLVAVVATVAVYLLYKYRRKEDKAE